MDTKNTIALIWTSDSNQIDREGSRRQIRSHAIRQGLARRRRGLEQRQANFVQQCPGIHFPDRSGRSHQDNIERAEQAATASQPVDLVLRHSLSRNAIHNQIFGTFVDDVTTHFHRRARCSELRCFYWIDSLPYMPDRGSALDAGILAVGLASLARRSNERRHFHHAAKAYGRALCHLRVDLSNAATALEDRTLCVCLVLLLYQYFTDDPDKQSYVSHIMGIAEIVRARGPTSFQTGLSNDLYRCCRINIIMASLILRKRTFLAETAWLEVPWCGKKKPPIEHFVDCMTRIPALRERFEVACGVGTLSMSATNLWALRDDIWVTISECVRTQRQLANDFKPSAIGETVLNVPCSTYEDHRPIPWSLGFSSLLAANGLCCFWSSLVDLYNMQGHILSLIARHESADGGLTNMATNTPGNMNAFVETPPGMIYRPAVSNDSSATMIPCDVLETMTPQPACQRIRSEDCRSLATNFAVQICMSVQYCIQPAFGAIGPFFMMFGLKMAVRCFANNLPDTADHLAWAQQIVTMLDNQIPLTSPIFEDDTVYFPTKLL
jgi:hypothetical protein